VIVSPANSSNQPGGSYRKPKADVYTVLLVITLIALLIAILVLYFEMDMYEWKLEGGPTVSANSSTTLAMNEGSGTRVQRLIVSDVPIVSFSLTAAPYSPTPEPCPLTPDP
jgi:hypothetical protein